MGFLGWVVSGGIVAWNEKLITVSKCSLNIQHSAVQCNKRDFFSFRAWEGEYGMLIRFTVENFLSFKDEVEFSMVAGRTRRHKDHILPRTKRGDVRLLKTAVLYGANAAGKSNLIKAMDFARNLIVDGKSLGQNIPVTPYLFDVNTKDKPSKFQFEFKAGQKSYVYGFEVDANQVRTEWLYEIQAASHKLIYERSTDADGSARLEAGSAQLRIGEKTDFVQLMEDTTPKNQLVLKHGVENKAAFLRDVYEWFRTTLVLVFPESRLSVGFGIRFKGNEEYKTTVGRIISAFDLGFLELDLPEYDLDSDWRLPPEIKEFILQKIREMPRDNDGNVAAFITDLDIFIEADKHDDIRAYKFVTLHDVAGQTKPEVLELTDESDGTRRLFDLMPALLDLLDEERERVFVIDELDKRLHPRLSHKLLELYLSNSLELSSQLIATTHEIMLLDLDLLRRDEVWLINKDGNGCSSVYSLEEFHPRYDKDIRKSYLQGRFGAVPLLPSRRKLKLQR